MFWKRAATRSQEYAESIINTVREPLIVLDHNLRVVTVSRSFYEFFKVKPEETVGQLIYDLGNKQWDIPKLRELLETILPQKATFDNYEVEHDFATIGRRTMLLNARQIQRVLGKERIILLAIEDITEHREIENGLEKTRKEQEVTKVSEAEAREYAERKKAASQLATAQQRYQELFDNVFIGLLRSTPGPEGAFTEVNPAMVKMFEADSREQLMALHPSDIYLDPSQRRIVSDTLMSKGFVQGVEVRFKTLKARSIWCRISAVKRTDANGQIYFDNTIEDITESKRAEEALQSSEALLQTAINILPVGLWIIDVEGKIVISSAAAQQIWAGVHYVGIDQLGEYKGWRTNSGKLIEAHEWAGARALEKGETSIEEEVEIECFDGTHKIILDSAVPLRKRDGSIGGAITINQDITERKRAEEKLQKSGKRLREAQEMAHLGFWNWDVKTGEVEWSEEVFKIFCLDPKEFTPHIDSILALSPWPEDHHRDQELINKAIETHTAGSYEQKFLRPDQSIGHYYSTFRGNFDVKGDLISIVGTVLDITERKLAEEKILNSEAFLSRMIEQSPLATWVSDDQGTLIRLNQACCDLLHISPDEVIGRYNIFMDNIIKEQGFMPYVKSVFEHGKTARFEISYDSARVENLNLRSTVAVILDVTIFPIKDTHGRITNAVIQHNNITERKRAEEALKISKERLLFATKGANLGIWNWNIVTGELIWSDQCKALFGVSPDDTMSYQRFSDALHPDDRKKTDEAVKDSLDNHKDFDIEYRSLWPDESIHWLAAKGCGFYDATGKAVRLEGVVLDITEVKRKEKEFKSAKSLLDTVIDSSPFAMWISDREGMLIRTNRSLRETLNLTDEQLIGKYNVLNDVNLVMQGVMPMVRAVFEMNTPARFIIPWKASNAGDVDFKGGRDLYIDVSMFPILDNIGELTNVVCQWVDVTERKHAEEALRKSETKLRAILDATPFPIALVDVRDDKIEYWSRSALTLFGHTAPTSIEWYQIAYPDPDYRREVIDRWKPCLEKAKRSGQSVNTGEYRIACRDGSVRICELYAAVLNDNLIVTFNDITERKRAEEALYESENKFKYVFDNSVIGKSITLPSGDVNANKGLCEMLGYSVEELNRQRWQDITHPDDVELTRNALDSIISGGKEAVRFVKRYIHKNGSIVWGDVTTYLRRDLEGKPIYFITAVVDITERKRTEEKILRHLEELGRWQEVTLGREDRVRQLKREVDELLVRLGETMRYPSQEGTSNMQETEKA